jgi:sterol 14-demethylase
MLAVLSALLDGYLRTQSALAAYVPLLQNGYVFAAAALALLAVPLYLLFVHEWDARLPPRLPLVVPALLGKYKLSTTGPITLVRKGYEQLGDIFRIKVGRQGITFLIGPEANAVLFDSNDNDMTQREVYRFTKPVFGENIVYDAPPGIMSQQLKFVRNGLTGPSMMAHARKIITEVHDFFATWGDEGEVNLRDALAELTILTAARTLLGSEIRSRVDREFAPLYRTLNEGMTHLSIFWPTAPTHAHRVRDQSRAAIAKIFSGVIQERRRRQAEAAAGAERPDDFLQLLMDCEYRDGTKPTDDEITGLLLAALFAGQHTSSITSALMGYNIIKHANKGGLVDKLREEQRRVRAQSGGEVTFEALNAMDLMHACMKETLRLFPPLVLLMRYVQTPTQYKQYVIPRGEIVMVCPVVTHRMTEIYTNTLEFDPFRFLPPRDEGAQKYAFIAFGGGRHACLGEKFAFLQIKAIWSELLTKFDFELANPEEVQVDYTALVAEPINPCRVRYRRRKAA